MEVIHVNYDLHNFQTHGQVMGNSGAPELWDQIEDIHYASTTTTTIAVLFKPIFGQFLTDFGHFFNIVGQKVLKLWLWLPERQELFAGLVWGGVQSINKIKPWWGIILTT